MRRFVRLPTGDQTAGKTGHPWNRDAGPNRMALLAPGHARYADVFF